MRMEIKSIVCTLALLIAGCASPIQSEASKDKPLQRQLALAERLLPADSSAQPRVIYAGFAMSSRSKAFASDIDAGARFARQIDPDAVVVELADPAPGAASAYPLANRSNIREVLARLGKAARAQDKFIVLFSTHGAVDWLELNIGGKFDAPVSSAELRQWLAPLAGKPTVLVLSACHSGSLLPALQRPDRVIFMAAAANRVSFGCSFESRGTYFSDALFDRPFDASLSLAQLMAHARQEVGRRETEMRLSPPSEPQFFVGSDMKTMAETPLTDLRQAPFKAGKTPGKASGKTAWAAR